MGCKAPGMGLGTHLSWKVSPGLAPDMPGVVVPIVVALGTVPMVENLGTLPTVENVGTLPMVMSLRTLPMVENLGTVSMVEPLGTVSMVMSLGTLPIKASLGTVPTPARLCPAGFGAEGLTGLLVPGSREEQRLFLVSAENIGGFKTQRVCQI